MGQNEKKAYLEAIKLRYEKARRKQKAQILDEFCIVCKYHRKHGIRLLGKPFKQNKSKLPKKRGAESVYNQPCILGPLINVSYG